MGTHQNRRKFYEKQSLVPFEEDLSHEFKAHRNLGADEIPPWCYFQGTTTRTRKAVSRSICAFLNAGIKGTVYLGITDQGVCLGLVLSKHQRNHILVALKDLMMRFEPPVAEHLYSVEFVPVRSSDTHNIDTENIGREDLGNHLKGHLLRTYDSCWCDIQAMEEIDAGKVLPICVVEITVSPEKPGFKLTENEEYDLVLPPVYMNEEKLCFFRQNASNVQFNMQEIHDFTVRQIDEAYKPLVDSLSEELSNFSAIHSTRSRRQRQKDNADLSTSSTVE